jgi:signal transduction histidine kinase
MSSSNKIQLLQTEAALDALSTLRRGEDISRISLGGLSPDDRTYLEAENCVRQARYSQVEVVIAAGTSPWVRSLAFCYRDLFTNPSRALEALDFLESECPHYLDLQLRLQFWRTHLNLILGRIEIGRRSLIQIASKIPDCIWKSEMLTIRAIGYYFTGRTRDAIAAHHDCQNYLKDQPDLFIQTFDCSMATRAALKLCDAANFEYFSERLDLSLRQKDDSRYRLRHTGYRAMIFNQLGEHASADIHWKIGDEQLHLTESALERGQYLIFRGMSFSITQDIPKATRTFDLARHELKVAGSPAIYLAELDIAEALAALANPLGRGQHLKRAFEAASDASKHFSFMCEKHVYPLQSMYSESIEFCESILNGDLISKTGDGRQSLVLSVIENISNSASFAKELSHFRLIPDFVHLLEESDLTEQGLLNSMEAVLRVRPLLIEGHFHLPGAFSLIESKTEVKTILEFASTLYSMGEKAKELFDARSQLREATRAKHLLHDVRIFSKQLSKSAKDGTSELNLVKLSEDLNLLIESYLRAVQSGDNPTKPTIIHFPSVLNEIAETTFQVTGKKVALPKEQNHPYLWTSDTLLKRLLINLAKNGVEAGSGESPVSISYKIEQNVASNDEQLVVYVSDNGDGLEVSRFEEIKANDCAIVESSKRDGFGLGLQSAIECAKDIGASITIVPTTRSKGTTFKVCFSLPKKVINTREPEIIVIDDSSSVVEAWKNFGIQEQIQILCSYGINAVALLNNMPKSVQWVVLDYDLKLPGTTGATLAPSLMKLGSFKIALSTGFNESELDASVLELPWNAILSKEPQYPTESPRRRSQPEQKPVFSNQVGLKISSSIKHEMKNEISPLRIILRGLKKTNPNDANVLLLESTIKGIERVMNKEGNKNVAI